ncbi:GNAT family N-acetyltransferase [Psychrobacillus sp. FSL K6-2684]|uniref:GNAT family N-acetyltransferase n=1 Tax=Psychrobacillus sp. FSL K6-2684 TaxID=2921547 RepID=UPI0030F64335
MKSNKITSQEDLKKAFAIREEVFVKEQGVPLEDEFDQFDTLAGDCQHILVLIDNVAVGTGRLRVVDEFGKLERICILPPYRKLGLGKVIVKALEDVAKELKVSKVKLHGQSHAEGFYTGLGYKTTSDIFMEDGIPHILMTKEFTLI